MMRCLISFVDVVFRFLSFVIFRDAESHHYILSISSVV